MCTLLHDRDQFFFRLLDFLFSAAYSRVWMWKTDNLKGDCWGGKTGNYWMLFLPQWGSRTTLPAARKVHQNADGCIPTRTNTSKHDGTEHGQFAHTHADTQINSEWDCQNGGLTIAQLTALCPCAGTSACHSVFYSLHCHPTVSSQHNFGYWGGGETVHHYSFGLFRAWQKGLEVKIHYCCPAKTENDCNAATRGGCTVQYIVLVKRPLGLKLGWHCARHWDVFCHFFLFLFFHLKFHTTL